MLVAVSDELQSGVPVVGAPELGDELGLGGGFVLFGALFVAPTIVGLVVEPWVLAWSDRADRRRVLLVALVAMGVFPIVAACAPSGWVVSAAMGCWGAATGIASGVAQGAVIQGGAEVGMARWVRGAVVGDLLAPVLVLVAEAFGHGWRAAVIAASVLPLWTAWRVRHTTIPPLVEEDEEDLPFWDAVRGALADPVFFAWALAVASCSLLDEVVLVLVALAVADLGWIGDVQVFALLAGSTVGGVVLEPLLGRADGQPILRAGAVVSALALATFVAVPGAVVGTATMFALGVGCAVLYPIAQAQAYARLPGRPGLAAALQGPFHWLDLVAPLVIGAIVSRFGVDAALLVLLAQPITLLVVSLWAARRPPVATGSSRGETGVEG